ncbi:MAG: NAD-dependent epimerase/dehydratase family protein [Bacteroidetes bacterium]|nr:NAD-dependent epimerase/dehydratase family protein [Bacteroidota bacterium]MBU1371241.1 NAD-dependent epimerase/dehydratase family protein [Bacteroidota bacterium]MBU1483818.1 NAD-dependent epimerase/dehydratase family protein [Bacteroidota bacterium]MBU1761260.1 NAD-dependent epimerase/dehydratase family protein [Bacteroidota bacterium]MBU2268631.1 NAD-dependent epimerase/dehydratase family protein [Bacteroidota bacterium]
MKVLVTGAAGFIGFHIAAKLNNENHTVIGLDVINEYYDKDLKFNRLAELGVYKQDIRYNEMIISTSSPNFSFIQLDLKDHDGLSELFIKHKFDIVINLAAQAGVRYSITNPMAYIDSNIVGFMNILECCRHNDIKHLIYASSSSVYGMNKNIPFSESDVTDSPVSIYAATKKSNELMAYTYSHLYKIPVTGLRFFTVYGPWGRPDMSPILFANAIISGEPIKVFNHGNLSRDFTYIDDIVDGVNQLLCAIPPISEEEGKPPYRLFNIGNNSPVELNYFISVIENALGKKALKEMFPMQKGDVYKTYADIDALKNSTGYSPSTSIEDGIQKFIIWYKSYYKIN